MIFNYFKRNLYDSFDNDFWQFMLVILDGKIDVLK